jgi:outer membrane receptor protein involved in Fe transport
LTVQLHILEMKRTLLLLFTTIVSTAMAQKASRFGTATGTVLDSLTQKPVEFANVTLLDLPSYKPINGTVCNEKGKFELETVNKGNFQVVISFVGYVPKKIGVSITDKGNGIDLGTISLSPTVEMLHEVVIEGQKTLVEEKVDRTIYNAEQDATTKGGDASDVLKRVPMLTVDVDGNVALRGSTSVKVLINNKPSTISSSSIADALKQIPADMIKTVEVITSPSAKYDAEGSAGIINIILKKNTLDGVFFSSDVTAGTRGSTVGMNGTYRKGKMGFSLGGFFRPTYNVIGDFTNRQITRVNGDTLLNTQSAHTHNDGLLGTYTLGWDYDINKNNSLNASLRFGQRNQNAYQDMLLTNTFSHDSLTNSTLRNVKTTNVGDNIDASLTYTKKFAKKDRELNFLGIFSRLNQTNGYVINTINGSDQSVLSKNKNNNPGYNQETSLQVDYQEPVSENHLIEVGGKATFRKVESDYAYFVATGANGPYTPDLSQQSQGFNYNQNISAAYLSYSFTAHDYTLKAGGRYEYTTIQSHFDGQKDFNIPSYGVLVPSFNLSRKLPNGRMLKISYNKRIVRPWLNALNPNLQASNSLNATQGNPNLKPEYANNYEIAYKTNIKNATLNISGYVRFNSNDIQPARIVRHDTIIAIQQNLGSEGNYGLSIFASVPVNDRFTINGGTDLMYRILKNNSTDPFINATNQGFTPNVRLFGNYNFEQGWSIQFFGIFQGRMYNLQGYRTNPINHSVSVRKEIFDKKGILSLGAENFATPSYQVHSQLNSAYLVQTTTNTLYNFIVKASFSYKIGKVTQANKKQLTEDNNEN